MARVLLHYDIADESFRTTFQTTITSPDFSPQFHMETKSVYCASFNTTPDNLKNAITAIKEAAKDAPKGTKIKMEYPTTWNGQPAIEQIPIV